MEAEQHTEQYMLPPAGEVDSLVASLPASEKSTALILASTSETVSEVTHFTDDDLDTFIFGEWANCKQHAEGFRNSATKLLPALMERERRFEKLQGVRNDLKRVKVGGWGDYLKHLGLNPGTYRKWKSRFRCEAVKQLHDLINATQSNGSKSSRIIGRKIGSGIAASGALAPAAKAAAKNLADAKKQLGAAAAAGNTQAAAIIAEYEQAVATADSNTLSNEDNSTLDGSAAIDPAESKSPGVRLAVDDFMVAAAPIAEPEKVGAAPDNLDPPVGKLTAQPDWKHVLVELIAVLEKFGDRLPLPVLKEKREIESLLAGNGGKRAEGAAFSTPTKRYNKVMKRDPEGNRRWAVVVEGEKKAWGSFEIESDADQAIEDLGTPVVSLMGFERASEKHQAGVTPINAGSLDFDEGVA